MGSMLRPVSLPRRRAATSGRDTVPRPVATDPYHRTHERTADPALRFLALSHQRRPGRRLRAAASPSRSPTATTSTSWSRGPRRPVASCCCGWTPDGTVTDMAPGLNVRTRVHEYGGGAYTVRDGCLVFSEFVDNRLMLKRTPDATARGPRRRPGPALRRPGARPASRPGHRGPGGPARVGHRGAQPALRRVPGRRRHHRAGQRPGLLLGPAPEPGRPSPGLADLGLPADALGRHRPVGGTGPSTTAGSARRSTSPAAARNPSPSRAGRRTARSSSSPTAPTGTTSIAGGRVRRR